MNPKVLAVIKSYIRGVLVAVTPLLATNVNNPWAYVAAVFAGVISPALRAMDKNDNAFGAVADVVEKELNKKVVATTKKKTK